MSILTFLPILLCLTGGYALFRYRRVFLSPTRLLAPLRGKDKEEKRSVRRTLILALSGTLGVGNITGVAAALMLGGAGSVLWMLLSSVFAVALKYAESGIAMRRGEGEGIAGVLKRSFSPPVGKALSRAYAFVFLVLALILGGAVQGNAILESILEHVNVNAALAALLLTVLLSLAIFGKTERILNILSLTLPFAVLIYVILCLGVLITNAERIPAVLGQIFTSAFEGIRPSVGGVLGTLTSQAVREGFSAGLLSNEAGAGTSSLAHEAASTPERSGAIGVIEVVFDTVLLCTLSAVTFLVGQGVEGAQNAADVLNNTFSKTIGEWYIYPLLLCISLLAISTNLCYIVYARRTLDHVGMHKYTLIYTLLFLLVTGYGGLLNSTSLVSVSHVLLFVLALLTSLSVIKNAN